MKFAEIIREAGFDPVDYPTASAISVDVYVEKDELVKEDTIHFIEPLFSKSNDSYKRFRKLLDYIEKRKKAMAENEVSPDGHAPMEVQITDSIVIVRGRAPYFEVSAFLR